MAQPLLRVALEKNPILTAHAAEKLLMKCLEVLYYRDARSPIRYELATVRQSEEPAISIAKKVYTNCMGCCFLRESV